MRRYAIMLAVVLASVLASGCAPGFGQSEYQRLQQASVAYAASVRAMTLLAERDKVDTETLEQFDRAREVARTLLDRWAVALSEGRAFHGHDALDAAIDAMIQQQIRSTYVEPADFAGPSERVGAIDRTGGPGGP